MRRRLRTCPGDGLRRSTDARDAMDDRGRGQSPEELEGWVRIACLRTLPVVPTRDDVADGEFLFRQRPTRDLSEVRFHDWGGRRGSPSPQRRALQRAGRGLRPTPARRGARRIQQQDLDFMLAVGDLFTPIPVWDGPGNRVNGGDMTRPTVVWSASSPNGFLARP